MDTIEATQMLMSRIKNIDPQNASKIMGYILINDQPEHNVFRLALSPDTHLLSVINEVKSLLDLSSNTLSAPSSSSPFPHQTPPRMLFPNNGVNGLQPCAYFAHGFCKKGSSCTYFHGDHMGMGSCSPSDDFLRINAMQQQQRRVSDPFLFNKCIDRSPAAAPFRPVWRDASSKGLGNSSSSAQQIYITFRPDSTFMNEDVSNYFSFFGAVQDVKIPDQKMRMYGFVTFALAETVKLVLAKRNPHFVCGSPVIVKPYKNMRANPVKKHQHQIERGDLAGFESVEPFGHIPSESRDSNVPQRMNDDDREINNGSYNHESVEYNLPDSLFSSPTNTDDADASHKSC
ncbi:hypothetical protein M8C21_031123 [Ambrosia artemisiifolia]|uniref:Uncharacterized protein n=1 Tax=Ambrosia artemisiifolia TaxID=4212 RepID=A0AAD5CIY9_AMBAR|nr:hypothetical protein M8C21_031123 [Ambrosia artemisiifolia]